MTEGLDWLCRALQNSSDGKFAAHEIREAALEALAGWGDDRYRWVYALLPLKTEKEKNQNPAERHLPPEVPPEVRTRLKNLAIGLDSYIPKGGIPYPISDLSDIEKNGEMMNI